MTIIKDKIYDYVQDCLKLNILPSAHEISKICNKYYISREDIIKLIDDTFNKIPKELQKSDRQLILNFVNMFKEELEK